LVLCALGGTGEPPWVEHRFSGASSKPFLDLGFSPGGSALGFSRAAKRLKGGSAGLQPGEELAHRNRL